MFYVVDIIFESFLGKSEQSNYNITTLEQNFNDNEMDIFVKDECR